jgi:hypothetical protein
MCLHFLVKDGAMAATWYILALAALLASNASPPERSWVETITTIKRSVVPA